MTRFADLLVYRCSASLADDLSECLRGWPSIDRWSTGVQLLKAADSIGANLAEAYGRATSGDRLRFVVIARASAYEVQHWISRASARDLALPEDSIERAAQIGRLLNQLAKAWHKPGAAGLRA
jgi:four helix bundle protein